MGFFQRSCISIYPRMVLFTWIDGWTHRLIDGWIDSQIDRDRYRYRSTYTYRERIFSVYIYICIYIYSGRRGSTKKVEGSLALQQAGV